MILDVMIAKKKINRARVWRKRLGPQNNLREGCLKR